MARDFTETVKVYCEISIDTAGYNYLVIFGKHINGGFIAIPNWNVCTEASAHKGDIWENTERLIKQGISQDAAKQIAKQIDEFIPG